MYLRDESYNHRRSRLTQGGAGGRDFSGSIIPMLLVILNQVLLQDYPLPGNILFAGIDDLVNVLEELLDVSHKWYNIGLKLKVSLGKLDNIEYKELDSHTSMRKMLACWLKQIDPLPTWEALADALESRMIGEPKLAQDLRSKYCTALVTGK